MKRIRSFFLTVLVVAAVAMSVGFSLRAADSADTDSAAVASKPAVSPAAGGGGGHDPRQL